MAASIHREGADGAALARPGEVLAGKYRVERIIGTGAMGIVVAAMHLHLRERIAIKLLLPQAAASEDGAARFLREARASVKIRSEHVVRVMDAGVLDSGAPFMVMEYLEGSDLLQVLRTRGPFATEAAVDLILQACEALAEAHAAGIIHRDLKPSNLFLTTRADGSPCVKVLDFGISKVTGAELSASDAGMTGTHMVMGSPAYMSPEQMRSTRDVDARTDVWSLGATLFELLTGTKPFNAPSMPQLCAMILEANAPSVRRLRPEVPVDVEAVIARCLEKDVTRRFASVAEFAVALAPFGRSRAMQSAERVSLILPAQTKKTGERLGAETITELLPRRPSRAALQMTNPLATPKLDVQPAATATELLVPQTSASEAAPIGVGRAALVPTATPAEQARDPVGTGSWGATLAGARRSSRATLVVSLLSAVVVVIGLAAFGITKWTRTQATEAAASSAIAPPLQSSSSMTAVAKSSSAFNANEGSIPSSLAGGDASVQQPPVTVSAPPSSSPILAGSGNEAKSQVPNGGTPKVEPAGPASVTGTGLALTPASKTTVEPPAVVKSAPKPAATIPAAIPTDLPKPISHEPHPAPAPKPAPAARPPATKPDDPFENRH